MKCAEVAKGIGRWETSGIERKIFPERPDEFSATTGKELTSIEIAARSDYAVWRGGPLIRDGEYKLRRSRGGAHETDERIVRQGH